MLMLMLVLMASRGVESQLIRPPHVYESLISGVHDYFNNTCILLLHATPNPMESQGLENAAVLRNLQMYFSQERHTRTAIMEITTFAERIGKTFFRIKRPLFVILNDKGGIRQLLIRVSTWIAMSYPTWLIFLSENTSIYEFFSEIDVPFDCEFMVAETNGLEEVITEVYRVDRHAELRQIIFGIWDRENGVRVPKLTFYQRRNNLFGQAIQVTSIENPPMSTILRNKQGEMIGLGGFFGRVMEILQEEMNCTVEYIESKFWGTLSSNGNWTGMVGKLQRQEVDLAASDLIMTTPRVDEVDFTIPIFTARFFTYIKRPSITSIKWEGYTAPFDGRIWASVGILIVVASVTITVIENMIPQTYVELGHRRSSRMSGTLFAVYGAFCGQGIQFSSFYPIRAVHLVLHLTAVIIVAAYSGALISFLTIQTFAMPFTTMEGLLRDGTYRFGVVPQSAEYSMFSNTTDGILRALFEERMEKAEQLPESYLEGLRRVCKESKYAFMVTDKLASALSNEVDCILESLDPILQTSLTMGVTKRSPYRGLINSNILMMRDSGVLQRIRKAESSVTFLKAKQTWTTVQVGDIMPLVGVLSAGIFLGSFVLAVERFFGRKFSQRGEGVHKEPSTKGQLKTKVWPQ